MFHRRIVLAVCALAATSPLAAQTAQATARLSATPARPEPGAIVRLTLRASPGDTLAPVGGSMAGEPLHFRRGRDAAWHAIGAVPVDAARRVVASAVVHGAAGVDTVRLTIPVP